MGEAISRNMKRWGHCSSIADFCKRKSQAHFSIVGGSLIQIGDASRQIRRWDITQEVSVRTDLKATSHCEGGKFSIKSIQKNAVRGCLSQ